MKKQQIEVPVSGIFGHAEAFRLAALSNWLGVTSDRHPDFPIAALTAMPSQAFEAFACELYLKTLLALGQTPKRVYKDDLWYLYEKLDDEVRDAFHRCFYDETATAQRLTRLRMFAGGLVAQGLMSAHESNNFVN